MMQILAQLLDRETTLVEQFVALLGDEQAALKNGLVEALADINARKAPLADQLNAAEDERNALLRQAGHGEGRAGMEDWLRQPGNDASPVQASWTRLLDLARQARSLNELNGELIALRLQATSQALAALTVPHVTESLYGPDGQAAQATGSRIIDAA